MSKIITIAINEIGTKESPVNSNKTKYGTWFGIPAGCPWCGIFVSWCYAQAGFFLKGLGYTKGFAGCQTAIAHFKASGEVVSKDKVRAGDIVFFDWNKDGRYDHTGLFEKDNGDGIHFTSIEGNTAVGNDSNGGEVMRRTKRPYNLAIFVHPKILDVVGEASASVPNKNL